MTPMDRIERHAWLPTGALGVVMGGLLISDGLVVAATVVTAVWLALAWWMAPWRGRGVRHDDLAALAPEDRRVVAYWRPGCASCARLRTGLGRDRRRVTWVNIWADSSAEAYVRAVNDGDAVVPTMVIEGEAHANPDPAMVRAQL